MALSFYTSISINPSHHHRHSLPYPNHEQCMGHPMSPPQAWDSENRHKTFAYPYVVTTNHVLSYQASGRGSNGPANVVDKIRTGLGCTTMDSKATNIIVARDEAPHLCGIDGRGPSYAYEGTVFFWSYRVP